jgi:hypothetical protein
MHVQHALHQPLFDLFLTEHRSVLSSTHETFRLTAENMSKASLLVFPLIWGSYFLNVCFYAAAMISVSKLLDAKLRSDPIPLRQLLASLVAKKRDLVVFSLLFVGLLAVGNVITFLLFAAMGYIPWLAHKISYDTGLIIGLIASIPVVYFGTFPALGLIRPAGVALDPASVNQARLCGLAAVAVQVALLLLLGHFAPDFLYRQKTIPGVLLRQASESLIGALPFVLLFAAFSILTLQELEEPVATPHPVGPVSDE